METNYLAGTAVRDGIVYYAIEVDRLRTLNAYKDKIPVGLEWQIAEAYHQLEGLEHAIIGRALIQSC
jgi:hypothetical protein